MKWFLILWAGPVALLGSWYWLSYYDMSFGFYMLTRQTHDLVFEIYGNILGIPPENLPPMVARAIAVDSLIVFAILVAGPSVGRAGQRGKPVQRALKNETRGRRIDAFGPLGA
jgi:hypothetical protein